ncbi:MAG: hypothetical protein ABIO44_09450 [Saprospiraceae bacterium]
MSQSNRNNDKWHFVIEVLTLSAVIINIYIQVNQQYKFKYYESQLETYIDLVTVASKLAVENDNARRFEELKKEFNGLYFGKSQLFEGKNNSVNLAVVIFKKHMDMILIKDSSFVDISKFFELQGLAIDLANSCRVSIKD